MLDDKVNLKSVNPSAFEVGDVLEKRYKIEIKLGDGSYGRVYLAQDLDLSRRVAIKILVGFANTIPDPNQLRRFHREAKALNQLNHINIVQIYRFGFLENKMPFLVEEYVPGETLDKIIEREKTLSLREIIAISRSCAEALAYAHKKNILHRDFKPSNIIVSKNEQGIYNSKILDFGLCKNVDSSQSQSLTETGLILGTPLYMSPEQLKGQNVDKSTDIYAFGNVLYEMVTGKAPFAANDLAEITMKHLNETVPNLSQLYPNTKIPAPLESLICDCLAKEPTKRPENFEIIINRLEDLSSFSPEFKLKSSKSKKNEQVVSFILSKSNLKTKLLLFFVPIFLFLTLTVLFVFSSTGKTLILECVLTNPDRAQDTKIVLSALDILHKQGQQKFASDLAYLAVNTESFKLWKLQDKSNFYFLLAQEFEKQGDTNTSLYFAMRVFALFEQEAKILLYNPQKKMDSTLLNQVLLLGQSFLKKPPGALVWRRLENLFEHKYDVDGEDRAIMSSNLYFVAPLHELRLQALKSELEKKQIKYLKQAVWSCIDVAGRYYLSGNELYKVQKYALEGIDLNQKLKNNDFEIHLRSYLGLYYLRTKQIDKAKVELEKCQKLVEIEIPEDEPFSWFKELERQLKISRMH